MEYRRLNKRQKAARWQSFHEQQACTAAQLPQISLLGDRVDKGVEHNFFEIDQLSPQCKGTLDVFRADRQCN